MFDLKLPDYEIIVWISNNDSNIQDVTLKDNREMRKL